MKYVLYIVFCMMTISVNAQQVAKYETGTFLLQGGDVFTGTAELEQLDILISDGFIQAVGTNLSDNDATVVDCSNHQIYPGFIDSGTKLGLAEISAVSLTQDHNEIGDFTPHMDALTAVNPNSVNIPVTRVNGVTTSLAVPSGNIFPGTAALIDLVGYTPQQMYAGFKAPVLNFPSAGRRGRFDRRTDEEIKKSKDKALKKLSKFWANVKAYSKIKGETSYNPQMSALKSIALGESPIIINVNKKEDILNAIEWVNKNKVKSIFSGVAEGYRVADSLAKYDIPVITGPILDNPSRDSDRFDASYANAGKMNKAGIKVSIRTNETENVRNLPYNAGFAAAYGLPWHEAIKSITINPAETFGIADTHGSITKGKVANLFVSTGDPFETKTDIVYLFIKGIKVPMESRHTLLYDEFLERVPGLKE